MVDAVKLQENMSFLDYDEVVDSMEQIEELLKNNDISFKWVEGTLTVYPDNYHNKIETSRYINILYVHNFDNLEPDTCSTFEIDFQIEFTDIEELIFTLKEIKNNTFLSDEWTDTSDTFKRIIEDRKKEDRKKDYLNSLEIIEIDKNIKHLNKSIKHLIKVNCDNQTINVLKDRIQQLKELKNIK